jgi:DNA mismatch endonuclease (patch repair protein)
MTDTLSPTERSTRMALVRGKNTKPELRVRRALHAAGLRYRLHDKRLPGRPDIVFLSRRLAVEVRGCMWHQHPDPDCKLARMPKSRLDFWEAKLRSNAERDRRQEAGLAAMGWRLIVIWECEVPDESRVQAVINEVRQAPTLPRKRTNARTR